MQKRIAITCVGSGDSGKTSTLIALAHQLTERGFPVTLIGFDPEEESSLTRLLEDTLPPDFVAPEQTITDLLKLPFAHNGKEADEIVAAIQAATVQHPAGFGVIPCDERLINHEVEGGDIFDLMRLVHHMKGFVLIDCAAGTGGYSLLSAVSASDYVIGVAKPFPKSIAIAKRACGLTLMDIGEDEPGSFLDMLTGEDEQTGLMVNPRYLGMIGTLFVGARIEDGKTVIAHTGISHNMRDRMTQIVECPNYISHTPYRTGNDQRDVKQAYEHITSMILTRLRLTY